MASGIWKYLNKDKTYKSNSDNSGQQNYSAGTNQSSKNSKQTYQTGGIWNYLDKDKTYHGNESVWTPPQKTYSQSNRQTSTKSSTSTSTGYNANKVSDLVNWSKQVRGSDASSIGDLAKQAQDFQTYFQKNQDRYDARTLNTVSNLLKNGQDVLQMNGSQALRSQQTQGFNRVQPNSGVGSVEGQIRMLEKERDRLDKEEYDIAPGQQEEMRKQVESQIDALRRQSDEQKRQDKIRGYASSMTQSDFAERSRYQSTANGKERKTAIDGKISESGYDDYMYDYINKNPDAVFVHNANTNYGQTRAGTDDAELLQMNEQEIAVFNYLYSRNRDEAYDFVETIRPELLQRQAEVETAEWSKFADENPVLSSVVSVPNNLVSSIDSLIGMGVAKASGEEIDPYAGYFRGRRAQNAIRGTVGEKTGEAFGDIYASTAQQFEAGAAAFKGDKQGVIDASSQERFEELKNANFGQKVQKFGNTTYGSVMSQLDNLMNVALTGGVQGAALVLMSTTAMPDTIVSAKEKGLSDQDAFALGVISGAAEYFTEKVSLETLFDMDRIARDGLIRYIGANALTEGSEEVASDFINYVAQQAIAGENSDFSLSVKQYEDQGMSHEEAVKAAWADQVEQSVYSFVGGAIAGGGTAMVFGVNNKITQNKIDNYGKRIRANLAKDDPLQNLSDAELGQMFIDQAQIEEEDRISKNTLDQAAQQVASGEEVSPVLADAIMNDQNTSRMLLEETGTDTSDIDDEIVSQSFKDQKTMKQALSQYAENMSEAEAQSEQLLNQEGQARAPKIDYVSDRKYLSKAVSDDVVSRTFGEEGAKIYNDVANRAVEKGMTPIEAYQEISKIYNAGNNMRNISGIQTNLPEADVNAVFKAGVQDSTKYAESDVLHASFASAAGETGIVMSELVQNRMRNPVEEKKIRKLNYVAKALGLRVNYVDQILDQDGKPINVNGYLNKRTKEIYISADADENAALAWVFGHEMAHRLQQIAPKEYNTLKQSVANALGGRFNLEVQRELNKALRDGETISQQAAQDEVVANFVGELVNDRNALDNFINNHTQTEEGKSLLTKIRDFFRNLLNKLGGAYGEKEIVDNIQETINALNEALETGATNVAKYNRNLEEKVNNHESITAGEELQFSLRERETIQKNAVEWKENGKRMVPVNVLTDAGIVMEAIAQELERPDIAKLLPDETDVLSGTPTENPFTGERSKRTTVFGNDSYGYSVENSTICIRSLAMELLLDKCSELMGHSLSTREAIALSQMAWSMTDQPTCQYCYVFADRMAQRQARDNYIKDRDAALKNVGKIGPKTRIVADADLITPIEKTNKNGETTVSEDKFVLDQAIEANPKLEKQLRAYNEFLAGRKNTENQRARFLMFLNAQKNGTALVTREQVASEQSMVDAVKENPALKEQMADIYKYSNNASHAKAKVEYTAYNNDILKLSDEAIALMNKEYGVRFYSYSDFHPAFILENMQMFTDAAVRGLKGLAYTKDLDYVRIFADTGANINVSLKMIDGTVGEMDGMQGADWEGAKELRDQYPGVGTVMVCTSDEQVEWALAQDWIDMVLPYHTCFSAEVGKAFGWKDFRSFQSDAKIKGMWNEKAGDLKSISPYEHANNKKKYLELCKKNNLTPRFAQWQDNPNYMKLVIETRRAYNKTPSLQPKFNLDAAKNSINDMKKRGGYNNPFGGSMEEMEGFAEDMVMRLGERISDLAEREDGWASTPEFNKDVKDVLFSRKDGMVREGNSARWTDDRIDSLIRDYGASNPDYSQAYAVLMNPRDYLKLTLSDAMLERWNEGSNDPSHPETYSLNEEQLRENTQTPFLSIYSNDGTEVQGHEGRHRMRALMEAGINSVPVVIRDTDTKYSKTPLENMTLTAQDFGEGPVNGGATITVSDLVPIKESNRDELVRKFGGNASVRFSRKDSEYMELAKDPEKNEARLRELVEQAAKDAGYTVKAYHGTRQFGFTKFSTIDKEGNRIKESNGSVFGSGFYFTDSREVAQKAYANGGGSAELIDGKWVTKEANNGVYEVYLNLGDTYEIDWNDVVGTNRRDFERLLSKAWSNHNSLTIKNIKDGVNIESTVYVVERVPENEQRLWDTAWSSSRIKSAETVVYDDDGNIIPLSERFNQDEPDIRYSRKQGSTKLGKRQQTALDKALSGQMLAENEFYNLYDAHQINLWGRGGDNAGENASKLLETGLTHGMVLPSTTYRYSEQTVKERGEGGLNYAEWNYRAKEGTYIALISHDYVDKNDYIRGKYMPMPQEIIRIERDYQPLYEAYVNGFKQAKNQLTDNLNPKELEKYGVMETRRNAAQIKLDRFSYESLISKPPMRLTPITWIQMSRDDIVDAAVENAASVGYVNEQGNSIVHVDDIDKDILVGRRAVRHGLDRRIKLNGAAALKIGEILKNAIRINELTPDKQNIQDTYVLIGAANNETTNDINIIEFVVNAYTNELEDVVVMHSFNNKEEASTKSAGKNQAPRATSSEITISELLERVNLTFPDILPEDVLKHFGYKSRPDGKIGEDALYSRRSNETMTSLVEAAEANYRSERIHQEFLEATEEWRANMTTLSEAGAGGFNRRMTSLINAYANGREIDKKTSDRIVGKMRDLARTMIRNSDISYQEISDRAGAIAAEIMWGKEGIPESFTFNEEAAQAVEDIKNDILAQILNSNTRHQKIAKDFEEYRKQSKDRIKKVREKRDARLEKERKKARETKERERQRKHESADRTKLLNVMRRLDTLSKKSDSLTAAKIQELIGDYDLVAKSMTNGRAAQLTQLRDFVDYMYETDPDFMPTEKTRKLIERLDKKRIADIKTVQEVRDLTEALLNLEHEIREHKRLIDSQYTQDIVSIGQQMYEDVMATRGIGNSKVGVFNWFQKGFDKAISTPTIRPETEILRLVGFNRNSPLYQLMFGTENSLASGQRDMVRYQWQANKTYFDKFLNDRAFVQEIMGSKAKEYKVTGRKANGEKVTLSVTPDLLMALYMHSQNEQNFRHFGEWVDENVDGRRIMKHGDGITIPDFKQYRKGNLEEAYRIAKRDGNKITMTRAELSVAMQQLSEKERSFINAAQRYYSEMSQTAINEVSEKLLGYSIAQVDNYFRINTDSDYRGTNMDAIKMDGTIEGMGFTKERTNATNAILLISLSEQLRRDIDAHGKYVGLAIPVRNFNKAYGVNRASIDENGNWLGSEGSVQSAIHGKWGKGAQNYIEKLMSDIQNPAGSKDGWKGILGKMRSFYAGSVLALNFGVAMKQAASYPTAAAEIGWIPLIKAFGNSSLIKANRLDMDLINKYSPLMYLRTQGMGYQELADLKNLSKGALNRALNSKALNWIQDIDVLTVKKLWKAAEYYVRSNFKDLEIGTEEYYKKVGEVHSRIIERTQPNYTTLQRGEILRSDSDIVRTVLGMFKTQPFQNFSIVFEGAGELRAACLACKANPTAENIAFRKAAVKKLGRAITSQLVSSIVFALMQGAWDWIRGKDDKYKDEEGNITFWSFLKQMGINMGSNAFGMVPLGSVMYEAIEMGIDSIVENNGGEKIFDAMAYGADASTATGIINDMEDALLQVVNLSSSFGSEDKPGAEATLRTAVDVGSKIMQAAGYPAGNFVKDVQALGVNIFRGLGGSKAMNKYEAEYYTKRLLSAVSSKNKGEYIDLLIKAYDNDKAAYDKLYSMYIENDGFATEKKSSKEYIDDKIEAHVKEVAKGTYWDAEEVDKEKAEKAAESAKQKAENEKKIKDAGVTREQQLKLEELLIKHDTNHDGDASQGELYDALKESGFSQTQKRAIWEANGFKKTMEEYAEVRAKEEAKQKIYDSVGLTQDEIDLYKARRTGTSQEKTYQALMSIDLTMKEREALWNENNWKKSFSEYANSR